MRRFFGKLYVQVLIGVFAGVALGFFYPSLGVDAEDAPQQAGGEVARARYRSAGGTEVPYIPGQ